jgi:hypothetical protein
MMVGAATAAAVAERVFLRNFRRETDWDEADIERTPAERERGETERSA